MKANNIQAFNASSIKQCQPLKPTKPEPFQFATNTRLRQEGANPIGTGNGTGIRTNTLNKQSTSTKGSAVVASCDPASFHKMLRSYQIPTGSTTTSATRPIPFKVAAVSTEATERKIRRRSAEPSPSRLISNRLNQQHNTPGASSSSASSKAAAGIVNQVSSGSSYLSMAEQVHKFHTGTPERFRSRPKRRSTSTPGSTNEYYSARSNRGRSPSPLRCTQAQTPNLLTRGRARNTNVLTAEQKELLELEEAKQNQFRARIVGEGVPKYNFSKATFEKRMPTLPEPFNLTSGTNRPKVAFDQGRGHEFHANPLNRKILEGPVGIPTKNPIPVIEPESPAFALKERFKGNKQSINHAYFSNWHTFIPKNILRE